MKNDELQIYRGKDYFVSDKIIIHQPTLDEICDWGEQKYFSFVFSFTATPTDLKYQLHKMGKDWNETSDYDLFLLSHRAFTPDLSGLLFKDLNFCDFEICLNKENEEVVLYNREKDIVFDRSIYEITVDYIRKSHNLKKNVEIAMTETTKEVLLEEAKENLEASDSKEYKSFLLPLISTMINMDGFKCSWTDVWGMKINAFMDSVYRIQHIKNADLMLSSGCSGFGVDLKKINKNEINYFYRPDES